MAALLFDRIKETTTTTGTGTITLAGAVTNFRTFASVLSDTNTVYYVIEDYTNSAWECGIGTYSSSTLARTTVTASSNAGSAVSLAAGTKYVYCDVTKSAISNFALLDTANTFSAANTFNILDAGGINSIVYPVVVSHSSTGTPGANITAGVKFQCETTTTDNVDVGQIQMAWSDPTHATRKGSGKIQVYNTVTANNMIEWGYSSGVAALGFLNGGLAVQQTDDVVTGLSSYGLFTSAGYYLGTGTRNLGTAPGGRLTLTTGVPVTTSDVTAATTIYYTSYIHNGIGLWNSTQWQYIEFTETSLALGTVTSGLPYDVFGYISGGVLTLEKLAWTNATTRATAATLQDGRYCKSGNKTRLLLGTFYTTSTTTTENSLSNRYLSNVYNQIPQRLHTAPGSTDNNTNTSFTTTSTTFVEANAGTGSRCNYFISIPGQASHVTANAMLSPGTNGGAVGIGFDGITEVRARGQQNNTNTQNHGCHTGDTGGAVGKHFYAMLVIAQAGTLTVYVDGQSSGSGSTIDIKETYLEGSVIG